MPLPTRFQFSPYYSYSSSPILTALAISRKGGGDFDYSLNNYLAKRISPSSDSITKPQRATAVYALLLVNLGIFIADKVLGKYFVPRHFYMRHYRYKWWQALTSCFCHASRNHLSSNLFLLLLFGRSIEDDWGWGGLLLSYCFCGIMSSWISLLMLPKHTVSIGASGAVFGLFTVSTLAKLQGGVAALLDWRKLIELAVLGEFVFRQLASEVSTAAQGGLAGINHVAHLSGAAAGAIMVFGMRAIVRGGSQR